MLLLFKFFTPALADGFPLEFECQQVSSSLLDSSKYLADINNAVVWLVSNRPCTNPLVTVPRAHITIGITATFMFHSFSIPEQDRCTYTSFRFLSILLSGQTGQQSPQFCRLSILFLFFLFFFFC